MAIDALVSGLQGALQGYDYMKGFSDPVGEARIGLEARRLDALTPYYEAQTRQMGLTADKQELELEMLRRQQRQQQATRTFAEFDSIAREMGGFSRALKTPNGQRLFSHAYNTNPMREEMGLPEIDGFEAIDEQNYELWGFNREDFERMRAERDSEAIFVPIRMRDDGTREPVLEDLDGDGTIDAYGGEQLEQMVRPFFMTSERAGQEFVQLAGTEQPGGTVTIGGKGGGQSAPQQRGGVWANQLQAESNGRQFDADGNPLVSPAGAVGIAQVMPATGPEAARLAGLEWDEERFYNDAEYNEALGLAYRNHLLDRYNGDEVLATAAYNGGMGNVDEWVRRFGDPRTGEISHADFVRQIPFAETQGYVMKVLGGGQQVPQQAPQQQASSIEQLSQPAIQSAIDVATGYNSNRIPSLAERLSETDAGEIPLDQVLTPWVRGARGAIDTALDYTFGSDNMDRADAAADRSVNQPLSRLARSTGAAIERVGDVAGGLVSRGIGAVAGAGTQLMGGDVEETRQTRDSVTRTVDKALGVGDAVEPAAEEPAEQPLRRHETPLGRRIGEGKGIGPGSAKRAADNEQVMQDVRANTTPEQVAQAGSELLSGLQPAGTGTSRTYSVTSSSGKPTHQQIGHAYSMMARGHISREEFNRFIDTGTISADGVALIERGMQEASAVAQTDITQQQQTRREIIQQQGQTQRERIKQGNDRDTIEDFHSTMDIVGPSAYGMSQEDWEGPRGGALKNELAEGVWRFRHQLLGTPNDTHSLAQGHRRLIELEEKLDKSWWEWYDKYFKGERSHNISAMPSMQALAAMDSGLVADENSARQTLRSVERYQEIMRAEGNPNSRNPQHEAQSLVNFYRAAQVAGVNPHAIDPSSDEYRQLMRAAIYAANNGIRDMGAVINGEVGPRSN